MNHNMGRRTKYNKLRSPAHIQNFNSFAAKADIRNPLHMIHLMLNDLRYPAAVFSVLLLEILILIVDFDLMIPQ